MLIDALRGNVGFPELIIFVVSSLIVIFVTLPIHEFAHGFVATKLGDPTPRYQGRLTLNPFAHIDYVGALMILFAGFGWAKPVQVNSSNFKNPKVGMAITAFAGPLANIILAFISMLIYNTIDFFAVDTTPVFLFYIELLFWFIASINISLAVFNLIPIPPLDGSRLLAAFLPNRIYYNLMRYERYFFLILVLLLFSGVLDYPLEILRNAIFGAIDFIAYLPFKLLK